MGTKHHSMTAGVATSACADAGGGGASRGGPLPAEDLDHLLRSLRLSYYREAFDELGATRTADLLHITADDLIAMGMPLEERSRMLAAIVSHALSARLPVYLSILVLPYRVEGIDLSVFLMFFSVASGIRRASAALLCII